MKVQNNKADHLLWLLMEFDIHRYLISNADGRRDGAMKAHHHLKLSYIYVASVKLCSVAEAQTLIDDDYCFLYKHVHDKTQELTDYLDEVIKFPLIGRPDYDSLAPKFFREFIELADSTQI